MLATILDVQETLWDELTGTHKRLLFNGHELKGEIQNAIKHWRLNSNFEFLETKIKLRDWFTF